MFDINQSPITNTQIPYICQYFDTLVQEFFREIANRNAKASAFTPCFNPGARKYLADDLIKISLIAWGIVDVPLFRVSETFEKLLGACRHTSITYKIAVSPQLSKNKKYFRGILIDRMGTRGNYEWVNPPAGMFYKVIPIGSFTLVSMKSLATFPDHNNNNSLCITNQKKLLS
jgi:hypothetical protein